MASIIAGYTPERLGRSITALWLQDDQGGVWAVGVSQRDLQFKFEVFGIAVDRLETLRARVAAWKPPVLPAGTPEHIRSWLLSRPAPPVAPTQFQPWPFKEWRTDVFRRAEYIIEDVSAGSTFGDNPNLQSALKPGEVPREASASCEVAVGLLFTAADGRRMLVAADWTPLDLIVSQEEAKIAEFALSCEVIPLADYLNRLNTAV